MAGFLPVLLGSDANVYGMARSFYESCGVTAVALCRRALPATAHSRLVRIALQNPNLEQDAAFVAALTAFAKAHTGQTLLLVPCSDRYALLLAQHRVALAPYYQFAIPAAQTVSALGTKAGFYRACAAHGLHWPRTVAVGPGQKPPALPFGYPIIVKPGDSPGYWNCTFPGKRKVFLARDEAAVARILQAVYRSSYRGPMLLQQYIPGGDDCLRVINAYCGPGGAVQLIAAAQPLLEEQTPEGQGNYAALLTGPQYTDPPLFEALAKMLAAHRWHGFANFDVKYHAATGVPYLLECNPRQGRSSYYLTVAGASPAQCLVGDLLDHRAPPCTIAQAEGFWRIAPWGVVRRYAQNPALVARAAALRRTGPCATQLYSPADGLPRRLWYAASQLNYYRKAARYFNKVKREK